MTTTIDPVQTEPTVASFFAESISDTRDELAGALEALEAAGDNPEAVAALAKIREGIAEAAKTLERSTLEQEIAVEEAALTEFQNALIAKKKRLAELSPPVAKKKGTRRTKAQIEADKAAAAAAAEV